MSADGTVLATLPRMILGYLGVSGLDASAIAAEAGLAAMGWDDADERVPRSSVDALWNLGVRETKDGALGLRIFEAMPVGNTGVMEVVCHSAPTVDVALRHLCRDWTLINDGVELRVDRSARKYALVLVTRNGVQLSRPWLDLTAVALVKRAMSAVQQRGELPLEVVFPYARDGFSDELEELARPDVSITEVAFLLGFSETSAFDRAFRRWTGKAPAEFRAARSVN